MKILYTLNTLYFIAHRKRKTGKQYIQYTEVPTLTLVCQSDTHFAGIFYTRPDIINSPIQSQDVQYLTATLTLHCIEIKIKQNGCFQDHFIVCTLQSTSFQPRIPQRQVLKMNGKYFKYHLFTKLFVLEIVGLPYVDCMVQLLPIQVITFNTPPYGL